MADYMLTPDFIPLEDDISRLKEWLEALEEDVAMFGATVEDETRMALIKKKLGQ